MKLEPLIGLAMLALVAASGPWAHGWNEEKTAMKENELKVGMPAPDFTAPSTDGGTVSLSDFKGRIVVLYFYPKDDTPGCTKEACAFRDAEIEMKKLGVVVLGISKDDMKSHEKFRHKYNLNFPLLSDPEGKIIAAYGAWKENSIFGRTALGVNRSTFVIDREGIVRKVWRNVSVKGHAREVLEFIQKNLLEDQR